MDSVAVYSLLIVVAPILCLGFVFVPCFVVWYLLSFSSLEITLLRKRELVALFKLCGSCLSIASLPDGAASWSTVCDCDIPWSYDWLSFIVIMMHSGCCID